VQAAAASLIACHERRIHTTAGVRRLYSPPGRRSAPLSVYSNTVVSRQSWTMIWNGDLGSTECGQGGRQDWDWDWDWDWDTRSTSIDSTRGFPTQSMRLG
jgi:hypothetical protein